ncbi:MAG: NADH-quinone oxidoreductase subunit C [Nitrosopumilaceae archaeon]|nr:NADH-quinone oxidoreductase subunit C [Nitrosopumilaceae archaeon]
MSEPETNPVEQPASPATPSSTPPAAKPATPPTPAAKPVPVKEIPPFEKSIADKVEAEFSGKVKVEFVKENRIRIKTSKEDVVQVAKFLRDEMHYDHAESVSGVDYPAEKEIEVVYHLGSYTDPQLANQVLALATRAPREENPNPGFDSTRLPSLRDVFYSVEFHERECFEMLGVFFEGHPDNRRLLLPEDWADLPPLRKDFRNKGR